MVMGAMDAARSRHDLTIPGDIAIVGFDDIPQCSWPNYKLSTISQPISDLVGQTMEIFRRRETGTRTENIYLEVETHFVRRASTM